MKKWSNAFRIPALVALLCLAVWCPVLLAAESEAVASFGGGIGDAGPDQFPGTPGAGWLDGWQKHLWGATEPDEVQFEVSEDSDVGAEVLTVKRLASDGLIRISRSPDSAVVDLSQPHVIQFQIRGDTLVSETGTELRMLFCVAGQEDENPSSQTALGCIMATAGTWRMTKRGESGEVDYTNSEVRFELGTVYDFEVTIHPAERTYQVKIRSAEQEYESEPLPFAGEESVQPQVYWFSAFVGGRVPAQYSWSLGPTRVGPLDPGSL